MSTIASILMLPSPQMAHCSNAAQPSVTPAVTVRATGEFHSNKGYRKLGEKGKRLVCHHLLNRHTMKDAAMLIGVHPATIRNARIDDPEFSRRIDRILVRVKNTMVRKIEKHGEKDWKALMAILQSRWGAEFAYQHRHEVTGKDGGPIKSETKTVLDLSVLQRDELVTLKELLKKAQRPRRDDLVGRN